MTREDIEAEYWTHQYAERPPAKEEFEDENYDEAAVAAALDDDPDAWENLINDQS